MRARDLSPYTQDHSINYMDDFTGFCDVLDENGNEKTDWKGLVQSFREHVEMANKNNMSLKASKTCFGVREVEFYGRTISREGIRHADHNLAPFEQMVAPRDISELRRFLGLCVQHKNAIKDFGITARPLHDLTAKDVPWKWRKDVEDAAFEKLRAACLTNTILAPPDFKKQFFVDVDASDDGKGFTIYQLIDPKLGDTLKNRAVIEYYSKAWGPSMVGKPPYYCEGDAL